MSLPHRTCPWFRVLAAVCVHGGVAGWLLIALVPAAARAAESPPKARPPAPAAPWQMSPEERERVARLTAEDHADMMRQLGIRELRPGRNGNTAAGQPNQANYDEAQANPYPDWPDALTLHDGTRVSSAEAWSSRRRPEIVEDFEREVYGRIPAGVPTLTWEVAETVATTVGGRAVVARRLLGRVDNSAAPDIEVTVRAALVLPAAASPQAPVPVLIMFNWGNMPDEAPPRFPGFPEPAGPSSEEQLIAAGWGYVSLSPASIQADNGAGLTAGIIGLTNRGQRRTPEQWGALRAWGWGASRVLDHVETMPEVNARRVGIEGVSRFGKAALVAMAFEPRFAFVLVGSSGKGGATPARRNFGEAVENLTSTYSYHWMAGAFMRYGAADGAFGSRTAADLPVDSHELIALCAPRPTFISYGVPEKGDALWLDQRGSFMAAVAAGPVFRLLGARDLGVAGDYRTAAPPPPETGLLDGRLAWRQHTGGHEDRSNMTHFIDWVGRQAQMEPPARLVSSVWSWDDLAVKLGAVGSRRDVHDGPTATLERFESHVTTLNPGRTSHPPHQHPQEEFIILQEGTLDVHINGTVRRVGAGSMFFFASNDWHNVSNVGDGPATYLVFNLATAATRTVPAEEAAKSAAPGTLSSAVYDWASLPVITTKTGERRNFFDGPTATCTNLECHATTIGGGLAPHAAHRHSDEEIIIVKDGSLEVTIEGRVHPPVGRGSIVFFASNDEHGLRNAGTTPATYYVVRVVTERTPKQ